MKASKRTLIKFGVGALASLRGQILADLSKEQFTVLMAKTEEIGGTRILNIIESRVFGCDDLHKQSAAALKVRKDRIFDILKEIERRVDVDTIVDVHTHPFSRKYANFSNVDDKDEKFFLEYLSEQFPHISYASIVFSQEEYAARFWHFSDGKATAEKARITTPCASERIQSSDEGWRDHMISEKELFSDSESRFNRSVLALGIDAMRRIVCGQVVSVVGVGGLGSVVAENLIHSGFREIHLIDNDTLSISNLNRIVGATHRDAEEGRLKVEALREHLENINPDATIVAHALDISEPNEEVEELLAVSDWVIVATDNHSSRFSVQHICLRYFTPFISAGVNITVEPDKKIIEDMSGEIVTVRPGDNLCLTCLGRIDPNRVAAESHPDAEVRNGLVDRGYVRGLAVKEPSVKTLNSIVACVATDVLINHYTDYQKHEAVWVYENNVGKSLYPDRSSVLNRASNCFCRKF